jgi:hypothetical protein
MLSEKIVSDIAEKLGLPEVLELFRSPDAPADGVNPLAEKLTPLQVFTQTDFDTRINTERQASATEATRVAAGNTYGAIDKRIKEITGLDKLPEESKDSLAYAERAFREKFGTAGTESDELKRLKDVISAKDLLLEQTQTKLTEMEVEHATEKKQTQINGTIDEPIKKLLINVPADQLASQQGYVKFRFNDAYTADVVDGKVQFTDKATGKVVTEVV